MSKTVQEIMTTRVIWVKQDATFREMAVADVLSIFDRTDAQIHNEISEEVLLRGFLVDPLVFTVTVKDGIVTLSGRPETSETGHEIVWQIRHLQGVVAVRDRLDYPPPPESPRDRYDVLANFPMD